MLLAAAAPTSSFAEVDLPDRYRFRVLFWGVFGALLLVTAWWLVKSESHGPDPATNPLRFVRRVIPSSDETDGQKFFTRVDGRLLATPLFAVLVPVEFTDVIFAVDSAAILVFVGTRMLLLEVYHVPTAVSLGAITLVLVITTWTSLRADARDRAMVDSHGEP